MSNKMTAHEWEIACGDLKAENDRLRKAIEEALPKIYPLCPSLNIPNHHCLIKDTIESLKKALAGKEAGK